MTLKSITTKFLIATFVLALSTMALCADKKAVTKESGKVITKDQPKVEIPVTTFTLGKLMRGLPIEHVFKIKNTGKADLIISRLRPD